MPDLQLKLSEARKVYGNAEASRQLHSATSGEIFNVELRHNNCSVKRSAVFGGVNGWCLAAASLGFHRSIVALVKPSAQAAVQCGIGALPRVVVLGVPLACSVSLGFTVWSAYGSDRWFYEKERAREKWEMDNFMQGEVDEMICVYKDRGLSEADAKTVTHIFAKDKNMFIDLMMVEELGYQRAGPLSAEEALYKATLPSAGAQLVSALLPLLTAMVAQRGDGGWKRFLPEMVLAVEGLVLAVSHSLVMHGAYTSTWTTVPVLVADCGWGATVYGFMYAAGRAWGRA